MTNSNGKNDTQTESRERRTLFISILLFAAFLALCFAYIRQTTAPLAYSEIGPASDPARWQFFLEDGTVLLPEDGKLPLNGADSVVICETVLSEDDDRPLIVVVSKSSDCVFFLDGELIYSPSGRYRDGAFSAEAFSTASGQFGLPSLGEGRSLTMIMQFQGEEDRLSRMPKLTLYPSTIHYYSVITAPVAEDALPAGVYFTLAVLLMGLFLIGLWKRKTDPGLLLLAFCALSVAFRCTASYSYSVMTLLGTPAGTWLCTVLPQAAMGWMLWQRLSGSLRRLLWAVPALVTAAMLALFAAGLADLRWVSHMQTMTAWIIPASVLLLLAAAAFDAAKGNLLLVQFFRFLALSVPAVGAAWCCSALYGGELAESLKTAFASLKGPNATLYFLAGHICTLLLIVFFIQAILELISGLAKQDAAMQSMALRERYAVENLEVMRQSQEETRRLRHEMRHHLALLSEMLSQKQEERAGEYVRSLLAQVEALPSANYSDNMVINAIAGYYLNAARTEGVRVETDIRPEKTLPLKDEELCVLLTNLLENALEACRRMDREQDRFLSVRIVSGGEHLLIDCENSTHVQAAVGLDGTVPTAKSDEKSHGFGLPAIRAIVEKHGGQLAISCENGCFRAQVTL